MLFNANNTKKEKGKKNHAVLIEILHDIIMIILHIFGPMTSHSRWFKT